MQSEASAGTRELEMLQSVLSWKNRDWNPQLKVFLSPHSALGLYYFLCRVSLQPVLFLSLTFLLLYLIEKHHWLGREQWEMQQSTLHHSLCCWQWQGEATWGGNFFTCILPPSTAISYSQGSRCCIEGTGLFHIKLLWGSHGLKWKHINQPVPLRVLNKY